MKKTILLCVAFLSLVFYSCSKDEGIGDDNGTGGDGISEKTYASFNFKFQPAGSLRSLNPEDDGGVGQNDIDASKVGNARLIIFNASTKALEYNQEVNLTANKTTVLVTSGNKKIFVLLNMKDRAPFASSLSSQSMTLDQFLALTYNAGTPGTFAAPSSGFSLSGMVLLDVSNQIGFPMSNSSKLTYTLAANVDEQTAQGGSASATGTSPTNSFEISVDYLLAKVGLICSDAILETDDAIMTRPSYAIRNIAKETYFVQRYAGSEVASVYYHLFDGSTVQSEYDSYYDYSSAASVPVTNGTGQKYVYTAENTNRSLRKGSATYAAITLNYQPKKTYTAPVYNALTGKVNLGASSQTAPNTTFVVSKVQDIAEIPEGTYFNSVQTLKKAVFIATYQREPVSGTDDALLDAVVSEGQYAEYENGVSWYRLNIGEGSGTNTVYGVERGKIYTATINAITGPGVPTEEDLITGPEEPLDEKTYVSATIKVKGWVPVSQGGILN